MSRDLASAILRKCSEQAEIDHERIKTSLTELFPVNDNSMSVDWQRMAAVTSAIKNISIISGGPGTGKTSTVIKILSLLIGQYTQRPCMVALAAPTGKAAARLSQAMQGADFLERISLLKNCIIQTPCTIHRLLGVLPNSPYFMYNADNPLPYDILVVDEASMIDCALMAKLFSALKPHSKIIVLGDKDSNLHPWKPEQLWAIYAIHTPTIKERLGIARKFQRFSNITECHRMKMKRGCRTALWN